MITYNLAAIQCLFTSFELYKRVLITEKQNRQESIVLESTRSLKWGHWWRTGSVHWNKILWNNEERKDDLNLDTEREIFPKVVCKMFLWVQSKAFYHVWQEWVSASLKWGWPRLL